MPACSPAGRLHGTRPNFEVVTGISAGAIIAPFAFLGPAYDRQLAEIWTQYETSELLTAQILPGLLGGSSLADTSKLAELVARYVDRKFLRAVAAEYRRGRILLIGTTNLDMQRPIIWNMGEIASSNHPNAPELFHKIIMASAAIPGAFPPVSIPVVADGQQYEEMHVDGGITRGCFPGAHATQSEDLRSLLLGPSGPAHLHHQERQADAGVRDREAHRHHHCGALDLAR